MESPAPNSLFGHADYESFMKTGKTRKTGTSGPLEVR
jgi:hypothetical protein